MPPAQERVLNELLNSTKRRRELEIRAQMIMEERVFLEGCIPWYVRPPSAPASQERGGKEKSGDT